MQHKVLRLSHRNLTAAQRAEIERSFGADVRLVQVSDRITSAGQIRELIEEYRPTVLEIGPLPPAIVAELFANGSRPEIPVIRSFGRREEGRGFVHGRFAQVVGVRLATRPLEKLPTE